ncbi:MAG: UDP-N-acetylmuramoyl-tripeptide--D-alanyl-D-alanine ligase [Defluviitaleaceae bacterium]|nr:UDP-N-acetylmuramoyl-tripeptide--D-alanyl-D-alanine ligase [Defluviitaleaceae bacterium]
MKLDIRSICEAVNGKAYNVLGFIDFKGVSIDSREELEGKIFIPIKGENHDGHNFLQIAYDKGAILFSEQETDLPHIFVKSTKEALKMLSKYYLSLFDIQVIGITGSVGKTTTKDLTASVLSQKLNTVKTEGNFNNDIGMPLTIFKVTEETEVLVLEMGMNHSGEIHTLANIARPNIAIITNIGEAHIEFLGSKENIKKAKMEILDFNPETIILNGDDPMLQNIEKANYYYLKNVENIQNNGLLGTTATLNLNEASLKENVTLEEESASNSSNSTDKDKIFKIELNTPGEYMISNALIAAKVGFLLGLSKEEIQAGIKNFEPSSNRMKIYKFGNSSLINDSYNASPASMKAVLELLSEQEGEKIAILGDMFELGEFSEKYHREVGEFAAAKVDALYAIGELSKYYINDNFGNHFEAKEDFFASEQFKKLKNRLAGSKLEDNESNFDENNTYLTGEEPVNSVVNVLLKASRGMRFEEIIERL